MLLQICVVILAAFTIDELEARMITSRKIVSSIQTMNGDIFDCFDINKQPAFNNPLLKSHKLQETPSFTVSADIKTSSNETYTQFGLKDGGCPSGTVPILRTLKKNVVKQDSLSSYLRTISVRMDPEGQTILESPGYLAAMYFSEKGNHYGSRALLNAWNPQVLDNQFSSVRVVLWSWDDKVQPVTAATNLIKAGLTVHPGLYGDNKTRLMTTWTADGYNKTGCYDANCPGFVHVNKDIGLGLVISPVSVYGGEQRVVCIAIIKDRDTGNWWLFLGQSSQTPIGYWPKELFTTLSDSAHRILWAGETYHSPDSFSSPPMGSGHFADEGWGKAAYISKIERVNEGNSFEWVSRFHIEKQVDAEKCYSARAEFGELGKGFGFFLGGPGGDCN